MQDNPPPDARAFLGKAVREARARRGWSQEKLADESDLHRTYIGGIERGERNVSVDNLCRIAAALEVPPSSLLPNSVFIRRDS